MIGASTLAYALLGLATLAAFAFAGVGLIKRSRSFIVAAASISVAIVAAVADLAAFLPPIVATFVSYGTILGAGAIVWLALVQEPKRLAERIGFKRRSREWEFDVAISEIISEFNRVIATPSEVQTAETDRDRSEEIEGLRRRLRATDPPTDEWAALVREYDELMALHVKHAGRPFTDRDRTEFMELNRLVTEHREALRAAYRAEANRLSRWQ